MHTTDILLICFGYVRNSASWYLVVIADICNRGIYAI